MSPSTTGGSGSFYLIEIDAGPALLPDKCICFVLSFVYLSMPCICIYVCDLPCIFICGFAFALQLYLCEFIYLVLSPTTTMGPTSCLCCNSFRSVKRKMFNTFQIWKPYSDFWRHLKLPMSLFHQGPPTQEKSLKSGTDVSEIKTHFSNMFVCLSVNPCLCLYFWNLMTRRFRNV